MYKKPGTLVISLDFELMWGMFDKITLDTYGKNLRGVHQAIPKILDLFLEYDIHATWATVGMLMYEDKQSLLAAAPALSDQPSYRNDNLSAYHHLDQRLLPDGDPHYFAPKLVQQIVNTLGQELASHTFSHYYCLEEQHDDTSEAFAADCAAFDQVIKSYKVRPCSIVFPRNQYSVEALTTISHYGFSCYRGTEDHAIYRPRNETSKTNLGLRGLRFLDRYLNLTGHHTYTLRDQNQVDGLPINIPASRQLHPYHTKLSFLEHLKLRRIKNSMTRAAKHGEIFHLWWHPHNFGVNQNQNFAFLTEILNHYKMLQKKYGMQSMNMAEAANQLQ